MERLHGIWALAGDVLSDVAAIPPRALAVVWGAGFVSALLFLILLAALRFAIAGRRVKAGCKLCVVLSNEDGAIRLNSATMDRLGLTRARGQRVIVTSLKQKGKGFRRIASSIENLGWRTDQTLKAGAIEISERSAARLFKGQVVNSGDELCFDVRRYQLNGFADYWMNPDPRARFSNRFAVYLTALVFLVQILIDRSY